VVTALPPLPLAPLDPVRPPDAKPLVPLPEIAPTEEEGRGSSLQPPAESKPNEASAEAPMTERSVKREVGARKVFCIFPVQGWAAGKRERIGGQGS
jgi:hypothetical protein